jgi:hypothetical protein
MKNSVYDCVILPLSKIHNRAGNITIVEGQTHIPFDVRRIYYLYDIPGVKTGVATPIKNFLPSSLLPVDHLMFYLTMGRIKRLSPSTGPTMV